MRNRKKKTPWIIFIIVIAAAAIAICFFASPAKPKTAPAGTQATGEQPSESFAVQSIVYEATQYSFGYTPETAPRYRITPNFNLASKGDILMANESHDEWLTCGILEETVLSRDNFDRCFAEDIQPGIWMDANAASLRQENQKAWRVLVAENPNSVFYYLLRQKNGDYYLAYGYRGEDNEPASVRWLFKLRTDTNDTSEATALVAGTSYVTSACLYMNPLSSFSPINGDSGQRYSITENALVITDRASGEVIRMAAPVIWGWQPFPYADEDWAALFFDSENIPRIRGRYREMLYQPLPAPYSLFCMDGQLWLAEIHENSNMGKFLWSLYVLIPESGQDETAEVDTNTVIERLFDAVMASPAASSNPGDYLAAHPEEERALLRYGDNTLRYIFSEFLNGGQTGLKGHVMRIVMDALIGDEAHKENADTGQAYFDAWKADAQRMAEAEGLDAMRQTAPKAWLLMQVIAEKAS